MFRDAVDYGYIKCSPAEKIPRPKTTRREMKYLSPEEAHTLIEKSGGWKPIIMLAVLTGMRRGEIFGLRWEDITPEYIHVRRTKYRGKVYPPKSKHAVRRIPIGDELYHILNSVEKGDEYLFNVDPDNWYKREFPKILEAAKMKKMRFHDLRHTFAALMISQGENPKFLQRILGHESFKTTMDTYGHLFPDEHKKAGKRLETRVLTSNLLQENEGEKNQAEESSP